MIVITPHGMLLAECDYTNGQNVLVYAQDSQSMDWLTGYLIRLDSRHNRGTVEPDSTGKAMYRLSIPRHRWVSFCAEQAHDVVYSPFGYQCKVARGENYRDFVLGVMADSALLRDRKGAA